MSGERISYVVTTDLRNFLMETTCFQSICQKTAQKRNIRRKSHIIFLYFQTLEFKFVLEALVKTLSARLQKFGETNFIKEFIGGKDRKNYYK